MAAKVGQIEYQFTPAQLEAVAAALHRKAAAEQFISEFFKYVQAEAKLPRALNGWTLKFNDDGKPFLIGHVADLTA